MTSHQPAATAANDDDKWTEPRETNDMDEAPTPSASGPDDPITPSYGNDLPIRSSRVESLSDQARLEARRESNASGGSGSAHESGSGSPGVTPGATMITGTSSPSAEPTRRMERSGSNATSGLGQKLGDLSINADDEDVQIAIAALGSMRDDTRVSSSSTRSQSDQQQRRQSEDASREEDELDELDDNGEDREMLDDSIGDLRSGTKRHAGHRVAAAAALGNSSGSGKKRPQPTTWASSSSSAHSSTIGGGTGPPSSDESHFPAGGYGGGFGSSEAAGSAFSAGSAPPTTNVTAFTFDSSSHGAPVLRKRNVGAAATRMSSAATAATTASQAGSDSARSSTASAIVMDDDGNPIRIELDSEILAAAAEEGEDPESDAFLQRVGKIPLVRGTLRAYELGKQKSRMVKVRFFPSDVEES